jgi:L-2-amino-thiazoline-4-carboxylic acid hydrolase-like protein
MSENGRISYLKRSKIQSETLMPVVKAFEKEIGKERTHAIVREALRVNTSSVYENLRKGFKGNPIDLVVGGLPMFAEDGALEYEVLDQTEDSFDINITRCAYAEFYKKLGEPDLGLLFQCDLDYAIVEGLGPDIEFKRTQTIMQGATHCDFRYCRMK